MSYIIINMQPREVGVYDGKPPAESLLPEDLVETNKEGMVLLFPDLEKADVYREEHEIDGQIVELPTY